MTLDSSRSRFSCGESQNVEVKHSVKNLMLKSSSVDAEVAVPNGVRQLDSSVETDEQDSEMSSLGYGKAQLNPFVRQRVNDDFRRQQVDLEDGELQSMSHKLMKMTVNQLSNSEMYSSGDDENLDKDEDMEVDMEMLEREELARSTYTVLSLSRRRDPEVVERRFL